MVEGETLVGERTFGALDFLVCVALVYAVGTSVLMVLGRENSRLQFPLLGADMMLITGIIYMYGGMSNEYYLLYYLPILQASVRLNFRDAIASALLSSGLYGLVGLSSGPDTLVPTTAQLRAGTFAASAVFMAAFFAFSAWLPGDPSWGLAGEFSRVLGPVWRIVIASITAEIAAEMVDTEVYHLWVTRITRHYQWARVLVSNAFSVPLDSLNAAVEQSILAAFIFRGLPHLQQLLPKGIEFLKSI